MSAKAKLLLFFFFIPSFFGRMEGLRAQELNAEVEIIHQQVQNAQSGIFDNLEEAVRDFLNTTQWTGMEYQPQERIDCNLLIQVEERVSAGKFRGKIQVQSGRVVYNSNYNSTVLNYNDRDLEFEFVPNTTLRFSIDRYRNELSSILAFYAFMIIGMDYDTFIEEGGTPYYEKAQSVVNNAQNQGGSGWDPQDSKNNRYWLAENMLNDAYEPLRKCLYTYHREGLDKMYDDPKEGRAKVVEGLKKLEDLYQRRPGNFHLQLFFTAKANEIVKIFQKGDARTRQEISTYLQRIDPSNSSKYKEIAER